MDMNVRTLLSTMASSCIKWLVWAYNALTEKEKLALPSDLAVPLPDTIYETVILFHDKTTFQANDDQPTLWAERKTVTYVEGVPGGSNFEKLVKDYKSPSRHIKEFLSINSFLPD